MRLIRFGILCTGLAALVACSGEDVSAPDLPALGGVRFINALADTGAVDIRMVDQVEWSAFANALNFRQGTEHMPTEAKARHIRVFSFANRDVNTVQQVIHDTTIVVSANTNVTLLLTGSARARTAKFVVISDTPPTLAAGQIAVRAVNASTGAVNAYVVDTTTDAVTGVSPAASNLGVNSTSSYVTRAAGRVALTVTDPGSTTANAAVNGPAAPADPAGTGYNKAAGVRNAGSVFSVYYFPRGVAGSLQTATTPGIVWFVDQRPVGS
jgi:hypothetical protein